MKKNFKKWWKKKSYTFKGFIIGIPLYFILILLFALFFIIWQTLLGFSGPYHCFGKVNVPCSFIKHLAQILLVALIYSFWTVPLCILGSTLVGLVIDIIKKFKKK